MVNPAVEITFGPHAAQPPTTYSLLRSIKCDGGPGSWPTGTTYVEIIRPLGGGRSGGAVLLAEMHRHSSRSLCVIKIDQADALAREWAAYEKHVEPLTTALFAPIIAATPDVIAGAADRDDLAAVVYSEASEYTGKPGDEVRTLGELVAMAETDPASLKETLGVLEHALRAAKPLHGDCSIESGKQPLRFLNPTLGPSLVLRVDEEPANRIVDDEVLRRTLGGFSGDLRPGDRIRLRGLTVDDGLLVGQEIKLSYEGSVRDPKSVSGTVLWSRGRERQALLRDAVGPTEVTDQWWRVGDVVVANPFTALEEVLTESVVDRVYSRSHGDLNAGNIVVVGNHPCFIDYAHTTDRAPQQADHAWLEVSFLRDQFADVPFDKIVRVQRALAVSSRLLHLGTPAEEARDRGRALLGAVGTVAFEVLFVVRKWAYECYPHDAAGPEWWRDHLCHLLISAHRTFKWTGAVQSEEKLRAVTAAASVATEWLTDRSPFTHWQQEDRDHAIGELRPRFVDVHGTGPIRELLTRLQPEHDRFIDIVVEDEHADPTSARHTAVTTAERTKAAVLTGGPRSGKTSVLHEVAYRAARDATRIPVLLHAREISSDLLNRDTLCADAVHLFVDGLDEVADHRTAVVALLRLHEDHPDLPILTCDRTADDLPFQEIRLAGFDEDAVLAHLYRNAPASAVPGLLHTLLDDPLWTPLDLRRPRSLAILDKYIRAGTLPASPAEAHERMLRDELGDAGLDRAVDLAARLLDGDTADVDATLVNTTVFVRDGEVMRFAEPSDQDFLAALALRGELVAEPVSRAAKPAWDGALRALLALPDTPPEVVHGVIDVLLDEDPVRAGHLLCTAHVRPPKPVSSFVRAQQEALRHDNNADALAAFGCPRAVAEVVVDQEASTTARLTGLTLLQQMVDKARPGTEHRTARATLSETVRTVLDGPSPTELLSHALDAIRRSRLRGLELHTAAHLAPSHPWPVVQAAAAALRDLGVALNEQARQDYHRAVRTRLNEVIDALWRSTDLTSARLLGNERYALVATLAEHPSSLDVLLRHRFAFDIAGVTPLLDRHLPVTPRTDLTILLTQVGNGTPDQAIAAAHQVLRDWPGYASQLVTRTVDDPDLKRLLIASAAVTPSCVDHAERIFLGVLPRVEKDRIEGLSALLVAIFQTERIRGVSLAWTAAHELTARGLPERLYWPWKTALARCRGDIDDLDHLLRGGDSDIAIEALATWDVLGTGKPGPGKLSPDARETLWRGRPEAGASPTKIDSWSRAVAAVGLDRAVPHLRLLAARAGDASIIVSTSTGVEELRVADVALQAVAHLTQSIQDSEGSGMP